MAALAAKTWRESSVRQLRGRTVTLKVKYADFRQITRSRTMSAPFCSEDELDLTVQELLEPLFPTERGIRLLGVTLSSLDSVVGDDKQLSLW